MIKSELHFPVKTKALKEDPYVIEASAAQRAALAERFALSEIEALRAEVMLTPKGGHIAAEGTLKANWLQPCAVSGEDFPVSVQDTIDIRFIPAAPPPTVISADEEIELDADDCDEIEFEGDSFDLGEAIAQTFGLAIDPYATGPAADTARKEKGIVSEGEQNGPLAEMLAALKKD